MNNELIYFRWLQNQDLDVTAIMTTWPNEAQATQRFPNTSGQATITSGTSLTLSVLSKTQTTEVVACPTTLTETIPAQTVYHKSQTVLKSLISAIQTQEELDELLDGLHQIQ